MAQNKRMYVDFHVLQTVPPSCVNRDDTGSPKTAIYGGTTRARVSSQSWKRAMRVMFMEQFAEPLVGRRTKNPVKLVQEAICALDASIKPEKSADMAAEALKNGGISLNKKQESDVLVFISIPQAEKLAELAVAGEKDKKRYLEAVNQLPSVDMALFGRMVASTPSLNYDAAAQVAHSISTHTVQNEYDYFTAVDDLSTEDTSGAGHLGTVEYNSATLYRYATVNVTELKHHLGSQMPEALRGFGEAFICSMPTGKQNSFANRTLPDAVYVTIREDQPINLSGAFEKAILPGQTGYVERSISALKDYAGKLYRSFAQTPEASFAVGEGMEDLAQKTGSLQELLDWLLEAAERYEDET
jgi:CRISPR system Cascade subunit CasC